MKHKSEIYMIWAQILHKLSYEANTTILGRMVFQTQENQPQGSQQLIWNAEEYSERVYYYRLQVGDAVANGKMVKVR